jgi:polyferredoxin
MTRKRAVKTSLPVALLLLLLFLGAGAALAEQRFPPPEFEAGHQLPVTTTPPARAVILQYVDVAVLAACLGLAAWLSIKHRSRRGIIGLSIFSLLYFGFYRAGCICAIGSIQNVALGLFDPGYAVPAGVVAFFMLPLAVALFAGRAFCSGVCPHGALQDLVLVRPVKVPPWLEHVLGLIPFFFLGAGVVFAATGAGFMICRLDPFVSLFRFSGSDVMIVTGLVFVAVGLFVGRPYCRFLCPYGALLRMASMVSKWRVRVTPDTCTQCRLCENACPYGAIREPASGTVPARDHARERRRFGLLLALLPLLVALGAGIGAGLAVPMSRTHPVVREAERILDQGPVEPGNSEDGSLVRTASGIQKRFTLAGILFGGWIGLVLGFKLISLHLRTVRPDYEPDRGACVSCGRCFASCPNERVRLGLSPASPTAGPPSQRGVSK